MKFIQSPSIWLVLGLLIIPVAAGATMWGRVGFDSEGNTYSIDRASIRENGDTLQVWSLTNLKKTRADGVRSMKTAFLLKCHTWEWAIRATYSYSLPNGEGNPLESTSLSPGKMGSENILV